MSGWRRADRERPVDYQHVWVFDRYYLGVTAGYWNGFSMCTVQYRDDAGISHWMPMDPPSAPSREELDEVENL